MNVSSSFVRCGVFCTYLFHIPCRISCASVLEALLLDLAGAAEGVADAPAEAGTRCFGAIVGYSDVN